MKKNRSIEFYRFIFCIPVILLHISNSTALVENKFTHAGLSVEIFFVLSGFLLGNTIEKAKKENIILQSVNKIKSQIIHLWPYYYITLFTCFFYRLFLYSKADYSKEQWVQFASNFFAELICINGLSYRDAHINGPDWYISSLLISTLLLMIVLLIIKKYIEKYKLLYMGSFLLFIIYLLLPKKYGMFYVFVRPMVTMLLGFGFYYIYLYIKDKKIISNRLFYDVIDILCLIEIFICFLPIHIIDTNLIAVGAGILILNQFIGRSHISQLLNNDISSFLGRLSLPTYLGQMLIILKFGNNPRYDITYNRHISYLVILVTCFAWGLIIELSITFFRAKIKKERVQFSIDIKYILMILSLLLFGYSFSAERVFFDFSNMSLYNNMIYLFSKLLLLFLLFIVPQLMYKIFSNNHNKKWIMVYSIIFAIYILALLLSWPGNWNNDEFLILGNIQHFDFTYHQSFFTNIVFILGLMLIPSCAGIIIIQSCIIALISTIMIIILYKQIGKLSYFLMPVVLSPVTIYFVIYPLRVGLYSFTFLLLFVLLIDVINKKKMTYKTTTIIALLTAVIATWRGESVIAIFVVPILLILLLRKVINLKIITNLLVCIIVPFLIFSKVNSFADQHVEQSAILWSFLTGLSDMVQYDNLRSPNLKQDLENINVVISLDKLKQNSSSFNLDKVYSAVGPLCFTNEQYNKTLRSIERLIIFNPEKYIKSKFILFKASVGLDPNYSWVAPAINKEEALQIISLYNVSNSVSQIYNPFNDTLRETFVKFLTGMYLVNGNRMIAFYYMWSIWIPILLLIIMTVVEIFRKRISMILLNLFVLTDLTLVFLMAPTASVMYFFPFYILGYVLVIYEVGMIIRKYIVLKNKTDNYFEI